MKYGYFDDKKREYVITNPALHGLGLITLGVKIFSHSYRILPGDIPFIKMPNSAE